MHATLPHNIFAPGFPSLLGRCCHSVKRTFFRSECVPVISPSDIGLASSGRKEHPKGVICDWRCKILAENTELIMTNPASSNFEYSLLDIVMKADQRKSGSINFGSLKNKAVRTGAACN